RAMFSSFEFPFRFDPKQLQAGLNGIQADAWTPHYNERDFCGQWSGVALRSLSGTADQPAVWRIAEATGNRLAGSDERSPAAVAEDAATASPGNGRLDIL